MHGMAMAQEIDFHINVDDAVLYACRVTRKALRLKMTVGVYCDDPATLDDFARRLWAFDATGFYPHVAATDPLASQTPVVFSGNAQALFGRDMLVSLGASPIDNQDLIANGVKRVIDIVTNDESQKALARRRFKYYREAGFTPVARNTTESRTA